MLIKRFNKIVEELERADKQRRNLTADIAHELRTPLHIIQGNLEGVLDGVYEATPEDVNNTLDETRLLSGHGPETTVGEEKRSNPFVGA